MLIKVKYMIFVHFFCEMFGGMNNALYLCTRKQTDKFFIVKV